MAFRDHLRVEPDRARAYEAEKRRRCDPWPDDRLAYSPVKPARIDAVQREAFAFWRPGRGD